MSEPTPVPATPPAAASASPPAAAAPEAPKPPVSPMPAKPAAKPPAKKEPDRRFFLAAMGIGSWFALAWFTFTASLIAMTLGTVRFLFPNVLSEPSSTFNAGEVISYEENKVEDKYKELGAWVILSRDDSGRKILYALSTTCTHLGCTPNWLEGDKKFKCPCHGSGFKISGVNFEGPAPRPLERYALRKTDDGKVVVDKSRKFQKELGQWEDPDCYILV